jgi:pimeloyl-ACP methyl ester carboxylesterase
MQPFRSQASAREPVPATLAEPGQLRDVPDHVPLPAGEEVRLDGTVTYVRRTADPGPDAEPALYVHGLGGSSCDWTDLAAMLADRLDGEAIDLPGFGRSDPAPGAAYTQVALAERVERWIEHSGRGPVHLIGNSLGGAVSVRVAAARPDLVRSLSLVSPAMPTLRIRARYLPVVPVLALPYGHRIAAKRLGAVSPERSVRATFALCFADLGRAHPERVAEYVAEAARRRDLPWAVAAHIAALRGLVTSYLARPARSLWRLARAVEAPTLVVWGRDDRLVDVRLAARTALSPPRARLLVLDGVGHTAQMESPQTVARAIRAMVDSVARGEFAHAPGPARIAQSQVREVMADREQ